MPVRRVPSKHRDGSIAVELAILLPFLAFVTVIGIDYARIFSRALILETASRNACVWAAQDSDYATNETAIKAIAMKDLTDTSPTPTITITRYTAADGFGYVQVKIDQEFNTITSFPGVPNQSTLSRKTDMRVNPKAPKPGTYQNY